MSDKMLVQLILINL